MKGKNVVGVVILLCCAAYVLLSPEPQYAGEIKRAKVKVPAMPSFSKMMTEYEFSLTLDIQPVEAIDILNKLNGATFLRMSGLYFTWNSQEEKLQFFDMNENEVPSDSSDEFGRQHFTISSERNGLVYTKVGWVDVDVINHRIVVEMDSEAAIIEIIPDVDGDDRAIPGSVYRMSCMCLSGGTRIGGCAWSWCGNSRDCRGGQNSGNCEKRSVSEATIQWSQL